MNTSKSICLFAHFNENDEVSEYVFTYLQHLADLGFYIVFISNSPVKEVFSQRLTASFKCSVNTRENKGGDFGAWKWAMQKDLVPSDVDDVLLANDSVFGPLFDLEPIIQSMKERELDFWGMTDSAQGGWHIQSYFLLLTAKVYFSDQFKHVFEEDFGSLGKKQIINKGEIYLSTALQGAGFKGGAFISQNNFSFRGDNRDFNPTHFFWRELIERFKFPFIKKDLVTKNQEHINDALQAFELIERKSNYNLDLIVDFFPAHKRMVANSPSPLKPLVLCHMFFSDLAMGFINDLQTLLPYNPFFVFNLSESLGRNEHFTRILRNCFPESIIISSPNKGRDIGGKLFGLNMAYQLGISSDVTLIIHDKKSQHLGAGELWRDQLFRVIEGKYLPKIFRKFEEDPKVGIVCAEQFIQNEYNKDKNTFMCTSNRQILSLLDKYDIRTKDYDFVAGNIFWIRTGLLNNFFANRSLMEIRSELETGNALDFGDGTFIHSWERIMSWISTSQGYKFYGV
ncbi:MAG TPA: rhamnan synthesis F family protein [Chryseolinea sp.]|nr:rhamnan synthesis F family protein [Chryseolinea sp.]